MSKTSMSIRHKFKRKMPKIRQKWPNFFSDFFRLFHEKYDSKNFSGLTPWLNPNWFKFKKVEDQQPFILKN
jgi:hypothetical protein